MNRVAIAKWSLLGALLVLGAVYLWRHASDFAGLITVRPVFLFPLLVATLLFLLILGLLNKVFLLFFGIRLAFREWFGLAVVTAFGNYLLPMRGGATTKALYLKSRRDFPLTTFLSTMGAAYAVNTFLAAAIGAGCIVAMGEVGRPGPFRLFLLLCVVALVLLAIMCAPIPPPPPRNRFFRLAGATLDGWNRIRRRPALLARVALLLGANFLVIAVILQLCFYAFSIPIHFLAALAIATVIGFTSLLSITPANLGVQEGGVAILSQLVGPGFDEGLAAAILARAMMTVVVFALGPIYSYILMREVDTGERRPPPQPAETGRENAEGTGGRA